MPAERLTRRKAYPPTDLKRQRAHDRVGNADRRSLGASDAIKADKFAL